MTGVHVHDSYSAGSMCPMAVALRGGGNAGNGYVAIKSDQTQRSWHENYVLRRTCQDKNAAPGPSNPHHGGGGFYPAAFLVPDRSPSAHVFLVIMRAVDKPGSDARKWRLNLRVAG